MAKEEKMTNEQQQYVQYLAEKVGQPAIHAYLMADIVMQDYVQLASRLESIPENKVRERIDSNLEEAKKRLVALINNTQEQKN